ncbi:ankyrin repeat and socs box protein 2 [Diplodia corticola]|uniref:Ankyrin repeat and socs box protein 2 n=1 Tax=Diplodia corticola TaxID=236234 RepID=A0A1J9QRZ1_9PEZI|nr:ankyrin repeat and socs box protein 2 [Diplodia corticola]OJD31718.1 ankyrin repeat and socs box protein 2 [Diplodia corticola]
MGLDPDNKNSEQQTPMSLALEHGDMDIVFALLAAGAGQRETYARGGTLVHYAVRENDLALLQCALNSGLAVDSRDLTGMTPLFHAVSANDADNMDIVQELLAVGVDSSAANEDEKTPLHACVTCNDQRVLSTLLQMSKVDIPRRLAGESPLLLAVRLGEKWAVDLLLESGFLPDLQSSSGKKSIKTAADRGYEKLVLSVLQATTDDANLTFAVALSIRYTEFASQLLASGSIDPDPALDQESPLHAAAKVGAVDLMCRLLQDERTKINRKDVGTGSTALHMAIEGGSTEAVETLLAHGERTDPDVPNKIGETPLFEAARRAMLAACQLLMSTGRVCAAPPPNKYGLTPLSMAAGTRTGGDVVEFLLGHEELSGNLMEIERALEQAKAYAGYDSYERQRAVRLLEEAKANLGTSFVLE